MAKQPEWVEPMLATLTEDYFADEDWIYERKLDGERCLGFKDKATKLMTRNRKKANNNYPEIIDALDRIKGSFIVDGEIVAFDRGKTSFAKLQPRMHAKKPDRSIKVFYYLFDILFQNGEDLRELALEERKKRLKSLNFDDPVRYLRYRRKDGLKYHKEACSKGWEGIIAKDSKYKYVHSRSKKWLKFKCVDEQEFVIGGYTDPKGSRIGFGALLLGYYEGGKLKYAGMVGTGFNDEMLKALGDKLKGISQEKKPFKDSVKAKNANWVKPELVCEVKFTEWTHDGKLRHPSFNGLRRDKPPKKVRKE